MRQQLKVLNLVLHPCYDYCSYASRVKLITNDAQKNSDNKEIARLKLLISKMKAGEEPVDEEVEV